MMDYDPGFAIISTGNPLGFHYGSDVFGPKPVLRKLQDIRDSLKNPAASGPEILYCISMDIGRKTDRAAIVERNLLFGAVTYASGQIGNEPVRSQGHIHALSPSCNASTCEVYEVWDGAAYIYMQEHSGDDAGNCYAVYAQPGDIVIVPPGWVHATINADIGRNMTFGAWCVRDFGFTYTAVRAHQGIAYFPVIAQGAIHWEFNHAYQSGTLQVKSARTYPAFNIEHRVPIYTQFRQNPDRFLFVAQPELAKNLWQRGV